MAQLSNDACIAGERGSGPGRVEPNSPCFDSPEPDAGVFTTQKGCYKIPFMNGKGPASMGPHHVWEIADRDLYRGVIQWSERCYIS